MTIIYAILSFSIIIIITMRRQLLTGLVASLSLWAMKAHTVPLSYPWIIQTAQGDLSQNLSLQQILQLDTPIRAMSLSDIQFSMLSYINTVRTKHWLKTLRLLDNPVAQDHSLYLFSSGNDATLEYMDHYGSDGSAVRERVKAYNIPLYDGFKAPSAWENLASSNMTIREAVEAWLTSPGHAENLLHKAWDVICVGHAENSRNIVVDFVNLK